MDLAFVTGHGPEGLVDLAGPAPIAEPGDIVVMGHRTDPEEGGGPRETDLVDERIQLVEAPAIKRGDPQRLGRYVAERLEAQAGYFWVHFDVDVFDQVGDAGRNLPASRRARLGARGGVVASASRVSEGRWPLSSRLRPRQRPGREVRAAWSISWPACSRHGRQGSKPVGTISHPLLTAPRSTDVPKGSIAH